MYTQILTHTDRHSHIEHSQGMCYGPMEWVKGGLYVSPFDGFEHHVFGQFKKRDSFWRDMGKRKLVASLDQQGMGHGVW